MANKYLDKIGLQSYNNKIKQIIKQKIIEIESQFNKKISVVNSQLEENMDWRNNEVKLHFISLGECRGDCILIESEKNILIDLSVEDTGKPLITCLKTNNILKLDYIIFSHFHRDHIGGTNGSKGLKMLIENKEGIDTSKCVVYLPHKGIDYSKFKVDSISENTILQNNENAIKEYCITNNISYHYPDDLEILNISEYTSLRFLNIEASNYNDYYNNTDNAFLQEGCGTVYNNFSMVVELTHNNNKILFSGDIEPLGQSRIVKNMSKVDLLKVEHHGLNFKANKEYLNKINPKIAVIMLFSDGYFEDSFQNDEFRNLVSKGATIYATENSPTVILSKNNNLVPLKESKIVNTIDTSYSLLQGVVLEKKHRFK